MRRRTRTRTRRRKENNKIEGNIKIVLEGIKKLRENIKIVKRRGVSKILFAV